MYIWGGCISGCSTIVRPKTSSWRQGKVSIIILLYHEDGSLLSAGFGNTIRISPKQFALSPIRWDNPFLTFRSQALPPAPPALTSLKSLCAEPFEAGFAKTFDLLKLFLRHRDKYQVLSSIRVTRIKFIVEFVDSFPECAGTAILLALYPF